MPCVNVQSPNESFCRVARARTRASRACRVRSGPSAHPEVAAPRQDGLAVLAWRDGVAVADASAAVVGVRAVGDAKVVSAAERWPIFGIGSAAYATGLARV